MAAVRKDECGVVVENARGLLDRLPRRDVIGEAGDDISLDLSPSLGPCRPSSASAFEGRRSRKNAPSSSPSFVSLAKDSAFFAYDPALRCPPLGQYAV